MCTTTLFGAIYIPAGSDERIAYILCDRCSSRLLSGGASKQQVFAEVELRIGPVRGSA
jgi:hypothetical protein